MTGPDEERAVAPSSRAPGGMTPRHLRLLDTVLVLGAIALALVVINLGTQVFLDWQGVLLTFFLAWLLSFTLLPLINLVQAIAPRLPRAAAVVAVYVAIVMALIALLIQASASLAASITDLIDDAPQLQRDLEAFLAGVEMRLASLGFRVDLVSQAPEIVQNLQEWAVQLVGPLQQIAVASVGILGNVIIIVMLSLYIAIDRASILAFLYRMVPPGYATEARLLQTSVGRSFGGFLRGQVIMGVVYGAVAALTSMLFGLQYAPVTSVATALLHAIPFFGPFLSWAPPVAVAVLTDTNVVPVLLVMGLGWFLTMNVLQPRLMAGAVGIHPVVVLGSVVVGSHAAGIVGAIFGIPIAAVLSAFFFHWYGRSRESGTVAERAAKRVEHREGRPVRRPREPVAGIDEDVDEVRPGHAGPGLAEGDRA